MTTGLITIDTLKSEYLSSHDFRQVDTERQYTHWLQVCSKCGCGITLAQFSGYFNYLPPKEVLNYRNGNDYTTFHIDVELLKEMDTCKKVLMNEALE